EVGLRFNGIDHAIDQRLQDVELRARRMSIIEAVGFEERDGRQVAVGDVAEEVSTRVSACWHGDGGSVGSVVQLDRPVAPLVNSRKSFFFSNTGEIWWS